MERGSPWENVYCKHFNTPVWDEFLDREVLYTLSDCSDPQRWITGSILERLQAAHLVPQQPAILFLPVEIGRLPNARLPADFCDKCSLLAQLQNEGLLRLRELRCFYALPLLSQPGKVSRKLQLQTVQFSWGRA